MMLSTTRLNGDGGEYLMTTDALLDNGALAITPAAFQKMFSLSPKDQASMGYPTDFYKKLLAQFQVAQPRSWGGYASARPNEMYSMHFWLYSLLALPFYWVLTHFNLNPAWAFGLLNLSFVCMAGAYLKNAMSRQWNVRMLLFLGLGTTLYLRWTGPEIMSACCVLVACIALLQGRPGLAALAAGFAASQNPSIIFIAPFAIAYWLILRWRGRVARLCRALRTVTHHRRPVPGRDHGSLKQGLRAISRSARCAGRPCCPAARPRRDPN